MSRTDGHLLLGEWACLGILAQSPAHGFAVAARLKPDADIGRVWSMSRALTYRALDQLETRGLIQVVREESGVAGGQRRILSPTRAGRDTFRRWILSPVEHLRDVRSELLLKILLGRANGMDLSQSLAAQHHVISSFIQALDAKNDWHDVVNLWRRESATAALRFITDLEQSISSRS